MSFYGELTNRAVETDMPVMVQSDGNPCSRIKKKRQVMSCLGVEWRASPWLQF
ncbi:hypothetical protein RchiOBHm_Chr2g0111621 [Rosa chinensis]|uniref:Uncharacterized protein n=1 Tax=Rosa chinensis TaxID=74649 RepID=A0A2P6RQ35_ROSCH|nr:hypothetical protein RchiOBHm_Chr2g0111621 [Rosa chinensis]